MIADGTDASAAALIHQALSEQGAVPRFVGIRLGRVQGADEVPLDIEVSMEAAPSALWDASVIPGGDASTAALLQSGHALEFLRDQYRHCKPIMLIGDARRLMAKANIPARLPSGKGDPGLLLIESDAVTSGVSAFAQALSQHRHFERESDPPGV